MLNLFSIYLQIAEFASYSNQIWVLLLIFIICYSLKKKKEKTLLLLLIIISSSLIGKYSEISAFIILMKMLIGILNYCVIPREYKLKLRLLSFPCFQYQMKSQYIVLDKSFNFINFSLGIQELLNCNQKSFKYELPQLQSILKGRCSTLLVKQISKLLQFLSNYRVLIQQAVNKDDFIQIVCIQNLADLQNWIKAADKSNQQFKQWNFLKIHIFKQKRNYSKNFILFNEFFESLRVKMLSHVKNPLFRFLNFFFKQKIDGFLPEEIQHMLNGFQHHFKLLSNSSELPRITPQLMEMKKNFIISHPEMPEYYNPSTFTGLLNDIFKPVLESKCYPLSINTFNNEEFFISNIAFQIIISIISYILSLITSGPIKISIACGSYLVKYSIFAGTNLSNVDIEYILASDTVLTLGKPLTCQTNLIWELKEIQKILRNHNTNLYIQQKDKYSEEQIFSFYLFEPPEILRKVERLKPESPALFKSDLQTDIRKLADNNTYDSKNISNLQVNQRGYKVCRRTIPIDSLMDVNLNQKKLENYKEEKKNSILTSVLIVEDNLFASNILTTMIKTLNPNISVIQCFDGEKGFNTFTKCFVPQNIRLIFMDGDMPIMNGPESVQKIKKFLNNLKKDVPIIGLTANEQEMKQSFLAAGVTDVIFKPMKIELLRRLFHTFLLL